MSDIRAQLRAFLENTPEITLDEIKMSAPPGTGVEENLVRPRPQRSGRWRGPLVAAGTAVAILAAVTGVMFVSSGGPVGVFDTAATETSAAVVPSETTVPPAAGSGGVVTIVVSDLTDALGNDLAGVLMAYDAESPKVYKWDGVAGFAVTVDADPFSTSQPLGDVAKEWAEDSDDALWPWPSGTATVPAGDYSLTLWTGKDYCCYSRWVPADSPGLRFCELSVSLTGHDQTIYIADVPAHGGPCATDPATAVTGTITIEVEGLSGMEGYRLLAGVWSETADDPLVGGAFWTIIDTDPYTDTDLVHPPILPNPRSEDWEVEGWGADDYFWGQTAQLEPGSYHIDIWANPGELAPYGSHIPSLPIERSCSVDVVVSAGENEHVVVTGIPTDGEPCQLATVPTPATDK